MRKRNPSRNNNTVPGFLSKTYKILENAEYVDIISWNEDGKAFKVKKPNEFAEKVLPKYFKTNNFASFLNMYDFHKLRHDSEENEWRHKLFRRGNPNLLSEIKRKINEAQIQEAVVSQKEQKKMTSDTQYLLKEMTTIKSKQESLEKACGLLIAQNTQILGENKVLWSELNKKKDKAQKKIEKLFSLFIPCIGAQKITPELAYMNGKKPNQMLQHQEYLKQEEMSDNENEDDLRDRSHDLLGGIQKRWDPNDLVSSINGGHFNNNNRNNISNSFNGGLNASNMLSSQNGDQQLLQIEPQQDENVAQKFLEGLVKNLKSKQENKGSGKAMGEGGGQHNSGTQFNSFVDNYHKSNTEMLQNLQTFMHSQGGTEDLSSVELNNQINLATMNPTQSTELLQKRPAKKTIMNNNGITPQLLIAMNQQQQLQEEMKNQEGEPSVNKKIKKNEEGFSENNGSILNPFGVGSVANNMSLAKFNLEDFFSLGQSNIFNHGNNKTSLDVSKFLTNQEYQSLALPQAADAQQNSPTNNNKKLKNFNSASLAPINSINLGEGGQVSSLMNKSFQQLGINDSLQGLLNIKKNQRASNLFHFQSQLQNNNNNNLQNNQWEDFNKFIEDQKIEEPLKECRNDTDNKKIIISALHNSDSIHSMENDNGNEEFLTKESAQKLNQSII